MVVLYSTGCPQCNVLKTKLDNKGIEYELVTDEDVMIAKGFMAAPILEVDGEVMPFSSAISWVRQKGISE